MPRRGNGDEVTARRPTPSSACSLPAACDAQASSLWRWTLHPRRYMPTCASGLLRRSPGAHQTPRMSGASKIDVETQRDPSPPRVLSPNSWIPGSQAPLPKTVPETASVRCLSS
ncbi:MAG: hypothetical protein FE78DRAFT_220488 [Acidomyces sp. 'richmondensis']|nr:MAG: hypothetical protein FE78DRAFT_220488 [Acidomyces sp. 'richmondensis']